MIELGKIWIPGPSGGLEALLEAPQVVDDEKKQIVMVCHPHPQHGGAMHNKVVTTLSKAFQEAGAYAVRFNYRGVGESEGQYGDFVGEVEDAQSVFHWIKTKFPEYSIALAGFSFGGSVAIRVAQQQAISQLITIAPAVYLIDYDQNMTFDFPWLLVQGWEDEVVDVQDILNWTQTLPVKPEVWCLPEVTHFFHGKLVYLKKKLLHYL